MNALGRNIHSARRAKGLSQGFLAEQIGVGIATVADWEAGERRPRVERLPLLATALNVTVDDLLLGADAYELPGRRVSLYLPHLMFDLIRRRATSERRTMSGQVQVMLEAWLKEEKRQQKSA